MHSFSSIALAAFCVVFLAAAPALARFSLLENHAAQRVEELAEKYRHEQGIVGMSMALILNGDIVYSNGFGYADREQARPATEHTLYRLASIAKPLTAALALQLWEQGLLDLDADVRRYVPEFPPKFDSAGNALLITARHLLLHQSGIRHYEEWQPEVLARYSRAHAAAYDPIAALEIFKTGSLAFAPGSKYRYTTFGYMLLGAVIERAGDAAFGDQLRQRLVGAHHLRSLQPEYAGKRPYPLESRGYRIDSTGRVGPSLDTGDISWKLPAGGLIGSVESLALFLRAWLGDALFTRPETRVLAEAQQATASGLPTYRSLAFALDIRKNQPILFHDGSQGKTRSFICLDPRTGNGLAFLCNTENTDPYPIAYRMLDVLEWAQAPGLADNTAPGRSGSGLDLRIAPNPAQRGAHIEFSLSRRSYLRLELIGSHGMPLAAILEGERFPGTYVLRWDAGEYPPGAYMCRLQAGAAVVTRKLILLR